MIIKVGYPRNNITDTIPFLFINYLSSYKYKKEGDIKYMATYLEQVSLLDYYSGSINQNIIIIAIVAIVIIIIIIVIVIIGIVIENDIIVIIIIIGSIGSIGSIGIIGIVVIFLVARIELLGDGGCQHRTISSLPTIAVNIWITFLSAHLQGIAASNRGVLYIL